MIPSDPNDFLTTAFWWNNRGVIAVTFACAAIGSIAGASGKTGINAIRQTRYKRILARLEELKAGMDSATWAILSMSMVLDGIVALALIICGGISLIVVIVSGSRWDVARVVAFQFSIFVASHGVGRVIAIYVLKHDMWDTAFRRDKTIAEMQKKLAKYGAAQFQTQKAVASADRIAKSATTEAGEP